LSFEERCPRQAEQTTDTVTPNYQVFLKWNVRLMYKLTVFVHQVAVWHSR